MAYQVLARKWRPQDFSQVVGQKPIVTALRNALSDGRVAQAYLFSGIRGVGKTSVARILAKALNCEQGPTPDPCNRCPSCQEITSGQGFDVLEFDAATYSKVDQIRELTESLKYGPAEGRYKVVILDEIHRLSRQAFDALLKIVEEPPAHLVFIFATTEPEAVPVTILSRCQEFRFRRVPHADLVSHLETVCKQEDITASPAALRLIARSGDGSVRDAVALLDQLATFGSGKVEDDAAAAIVGGLGYEVLFGLLEAIVTGASGGVSETVAEIDAQGWDPRHAFGEFLSYCRGALHLSLGGDPARLDLPTEEADGLAQLAGQSGYENLLRLVHLLLESEATVRRSESGSLAVEVAWLRAAELPKLVRLEELLGGTGALPSRPPNTPGGAKTSQQKPSAPRRTPTPTKTSPPKAPPPKAVPDQTPPAPPPETALPKRETPAPEPAATNVTPPPSVETSVPPSPNPPDSRGFSTDALLTAVSRRKQSLAAHLAEAQSLSLADGRLTILAPPGDPWLVGALERPSNIKVLDDAIQELAGPGIKWVLREGQQADPAVAEDLEKNSGQEVVNDPRVQTVLDIFGGSVESVHQHGGSREETGQ